MTSDHLGENGGCDENNYHGVEADFHRYNFRRSLTANLNCFTNSGQEEKFRSIT